MANDTSQNVKLNQNDQAVSAHLGQSGDTFSLGTLSGFPVDGNQMWFGSGNLPANYNITLDHDDHLLTALKPHIRNGADLTPTGSGPNGEQDYTAPAGVQSATRATWNMDYVAATGTDGSDTAPINSETLGKYDFKMQITGSGGPFVTPKTATFDLNAGSHQWVDEANPAITFGGDDFNQPGASAVIMDHVAENSINLGFAPLQQEFGPLTQSTQAGASYDFKLSAFDGAKLVGLTHDVVTLV